MIRITKETHENLKIDFGDIPINCKIELVEIMLQKGYRTKGFLR